jgi:uncharacterized membrane protein YgcG
MGVLACVCTCTNSACALSVRSVCVPATFKHTTQDSEWTQLHALDIVCMTFATEFVFPCACVCMPSVCMDMHGLLYSAVVCVCVCVCVCARAHVYVYACVTVYVHACAFESACGSCSHVIGAHSCNSRVWWATALAERASGGGGSGGGGGGGRRV